MEKMSQFERPEPKIVGSASEKRKEEIKKEIITRFGEKHYEKFFDGGEKLKSVELEKQPAEIRFIQKANEITNRLINETGEIPFDIPEQNFHIVPESEYNKEADPDTDAITIDKSQAIVLKAEPHRSNLFMTAETHAPKVFFSR